MRWELNQLCKLSEAHPDIAEEALQTLWEQRPELLRRVVIGAYLDQQISLSKAAELVGLTRIALQRQLVQEGIPIRALSDEDIQAEVEALRQRHQTV
jgi:predicted HTH domain antitoxin